MKKVLTFALLAISILSSCNSKQGMQDIQENTIQQEVKAQSNSGANSFMGKYIKSLFDPFDKNKDGFISRYELGVNSYFDSFDKNKDTKISIDEFTNIAEQNNINKEFYRKTFAHSANILIPNLNSDIFKYSELKKTYEGFITKEQFITVINHGFSYLTKEPLNIFYVADRNNDGKLNFSEYEDALFGLQKNYFINRPIQNQQQLSVSTSPDQTVTPINN